MKREDILEIFSGLPHVSGVLQAAQDIKQDELSDRFYHWAKAEGWNVETYIGGYEDDKTEYAWRAVKAFCL